MDNPFLNDDDFFKSTTLNERGELMMKAAGHKYIKRTGTKGNYKYWYRDPSTGKLIEGNESGPKKQKVDKPQEKQGSENSFYSIIPKKFLRKYKDEVDKINEAMSKGMKITSIKELLKKDLDDVIDTLENDEEADQEEYYYLNKEQKKLYRKHDGDPPFDVRKEAIKNAKKLYSTINPSSIFNIMGELEDQAHNYLLDYEEKNNKKTKK